MDVVLNTAGVMVVAPLAELNPDDLDRRHLTNMRRTFVVSQQAAHWVRTGSDRKLLPPRSQEAVRDLWGPYGQQRGH